MVLLACGRPEAPARADSSGATRAPPGPPDLVVDCNGGADERTIQAAIDAAPDPGRIEVRPCTYRERLDYRGKSLWIGSTDGPAATVLDAGDAGVAVRAVSGEGPGTALVGFEVRDAIDTAVEVDLASLRVEDVILRSSRTSVTLRNRGGALVLVGVRVEDTNTSSSHVIELDRGSLVLRDVTVACGQGDGLDLGHGTIQIDDTSVACDGADALELEHTTGWVQRSNLLGDVDILSEERHPDDLVALRNTVVVGDVDVTFGAFLLRNSLLLRGTLTLTDPDAATLENNVFSGANCAVDTNVAAVTARYNDFWQTRSVCGQPSIVGTDGNVAVDPRFVDAARGDFHLRANSALIDAGVPDDDYDDLDGSRSDLGVFSGRFTQDGGW